MSQNQPNLTNDEIIELGKRVWDLIDVWVDSEEGWTFSEEKHDIKMWTRHVPKIAGFHEKGTIIKGVGFVENATVSQFVKLVLDPVLRKEWDNSEYYDKIAEIDEHTDVCHVGVPGWGPISARDFVSVRRSKFGNEKGQEWYNACQVSISYPLDGREDKCKNFVRGILLPSAWRFVQQEGGCMTYYISGVNLGGWLPQSIVDKGVYNNTLGVFFPEVRKYFKTWVPPPVEEETESKSKKKEKLKSTTSSSKENDTASTSSEPQSSSSTTSSPSVGKKKKLKSSKDIEIQEEVAVAE